MEHTTVSFMGGFSRGLIAHELAHQWFGNKVTCGSWQDIWLNEGFATYLSGLVVENFDGESSFRSWRVGKVDHITSQTGGSVYVPAQDSTNVGRIFSSRLSYNKGSMVLHMLRRKLGDAAFYQGLQDFLADPAYSYGYAKTPDLQNVMETSSGTNLEEFFNDWVYNEGYPRYTIEWNQPNSDEIHIVINQTQSHPSVDYFEAQVPLRIYGTGGEIVEITLDNTENEELFIEPINFEVGTIAIDPDFHLISRFNTVVLGIGDNFINKQFVIYPNPVLDIVHILKPNEIIIESIKVFDVLGRQVMVTYEEEEVYLGSLKSGIHFMEIETNLGTVQKKIVKE
jgi:aminopeptidase N